MLRRSFAVSLALALGAALLLSLVIVVSGQNRAHGEPPDDGDSGDGDNGDRDDGDAKGNRTLIGDATMVNGNLIVTWARVRKNGEIKKVGVTIPVALFDNQPTEPGSGPAGAIASLIFPEAVRDTTYFNHFELQSNPHGHVAPPGSVNPDRNRVPHFDFHFYAIDEELVRLIPATTAPPRPIPVPAALLPLGYIQPGTSIAEMGRHSSPLSAFLDPNPLSTVMIAGFTVPGDQMHFLEPMLSREFLLERDDFELLVPTPARFGRSMLYPTKFEAEYDSDLDAYHFVFSHFVAVQ
jgi:hypothetical protein